MSWRETIRSSLQAHSGKLREHLIIFYRGEGLPMKMKAPDVGTPLHKLLINAGVYGVFLTHTGDPVKNPKLLVDQVIVVHIVEKLQRLVKSKIPQAITGGLVTMDDGLLYNANATLWVVTKKQRVPPELKEMRVTTIPESAEVWWIPPEEPEAKG